MMVGLTWGDTQIDFSLVQSTAIIANMWMCSLKRFSAITIIFCTGIIFYAFWDTSKAVDTSLLFEQGRKYHETTWSEFLASLPTAKYINFQTPFYPFLVSRVPMIWAQQLMIFPIVVMNSMAILWLFGDPGKAILSTPLYAVFSSQPSTDLLMISCVLLSLLAFQSGNLLASSLLYGVSWAYKPLTLLALPAMALYLGRWILLSLSVWVGYSVWAYGANIGETQLDFIAQQVGVVKMRHGALYLRWEALLWRVNRTLIPALPAFIFWLFPAHTRRALPIGIMISAMIFFGYCNIKYFMLVSLFLFPIQEVSHV